MEFNRKKSENPTRVAMEELQLHDFVNAEACHIDKVEVSIMRRGRERGREMKRECVGR